MFKRILIANRGEIAVRVIQACREMGIESIAVYSDADRNALHVRLADKACYIGEAPAKESYLNIKNILEAAKQSGAEAIHPGYGFLSENYEFITSVEQEGLTFIGPKAKTVRLMGDKMEARKLMRKVNVPIVPGNTSVISSVSQAKEIAFEIGYPVIIKASAGGGGKGMRIVESEDNIEESITLAQNEAQKAFNNSDVYIEKYISNPKHIEVQILADNYGNIIHLNERECSVQRRHQKVLEEAPSLFMDNNTREKITQTAINAAKACNYQNAGTIEFLMDDQKNFYFMEMNTRLQVEHPITEMITGVDIVKEQIFIASGEKLRLSQSDIGIHGHSIECRIYAEDIDNNFAPSGGKILHHKLPSGPGIRVDRGIDVLTDVPLHYDPILAKVVTKGRTREEAIARMKRAIREYKIVGVITNIDGFRWLLNQEQFLDGSYSTNFLTEKFVPLMPGKWREIKPEYENVILTLAAHLKRKELQLKPHNNECNSANVWSRNNYE